MAKDLARVLNFMVTKLYKILVCVLVVATTCAAYGQGVPYQSSNQIALSQGDFGLTSFPSNDVSSTLILGVNDSLDSALTKLSKTQIVTAISNLTETIRVSTNDPALLYRRGVYHQLEGEPDKALKDFDTVVQFHPEYFPVFYSRGLLFYERGDFTNAILDLTELMQQIPEEIQIRKPRTYALMHRTRGNAYLRIGDWKRGIDDLTMAINTALEGDQTYYGRGCAFGQLGQKDHALADFSKAIQLNPNNSDAYSNRGNLFYEGGEIDKAIKDYNEAIRIDSSNGFYYFNRGLAFNRKHDWGKAKSDYERVIRLNPADSEACNELAWLLATCPDDSIRNGAEAVAIASKACELARWKDWNFLATLATAYAESGDFAQAVKFQKMVLSIDKLTEQERKDESQRLDLFEKKKPYRDKPEQ